MRFMPRRFPTLFTTLGICLVSSIAVAHGLRPAGHHHVHGVGDVCERVL
jgi:hypothetical protein